MPRLAMVSALLVMFSLPLCAQNNPSPVIYPNSTFERWGPATVLSHEQSWNPDLTQSTRFPILLQANQNYVAYNDLTSTYTGTGRAHIFNPVGEDILFRYDCGITFERGQPVELRGRWLAPAKMQIVLRQPGTQRTQTCKLQILAVNKPPAASGATH
jgi:hypothetical protein